MQRLWKNVNFRVCVRVCAYMKEKMACDKGSIFFFSPEQRSHDVFDSREISASPISLRTKLTCTDTRPDVPLLSLKCPSTLIPI